MFLLKETWIKFWSHSSRCLCVELVASKSWCFARYSKTFPRIVDWQLRSVNGIISNSSTSESGRSATEQFLKEQVFNHESSAINRKITFQHRLKETWSHRNVFRKLKFDFVHRFQVNDLLSSRFRNVYLGWAISKHQPAFQTNRKWLIFQSRSIERKEKSSA